MVCSLIFYLINGFYDKFKYINLREISLDKVKKTKNKATADT